MWASFSLCVFPVMLQSVAQRPAPPSGKYSTIVFEPTDCIQVDFLPGEAADVRLLVDCIGHDVASPDLSVVKIRPFYYQVATNSAQAYDNFISEVDVECPYDVEDGDLKSFDSDYKANNVTVKFEGNLVTLNSGDCP